MVLEGYGSRREGGGPRRCGHTPQRRQAPAVGPWAATRLRSPPGSRALRLRVNRDDACVPDGCAFGPFPDVRCEAVPGVEPSWRVTPWTSREAAARRQPAVRLFRDRRAAGRKARLRFGVMCEGQLQDMEIT